MTSVAEPLALTAEAQWLIDEARALAASSREDTVNTLHVLAAALRSDTTFGSALRNGPTGDRTDELRADLAGRGGSRRVPVFAVRTSADVAKLLERARTQARADGRHRVDAEDITWALTVVLGPHSRHFDASEPTARAVLRSGASVRRTRAPRSWSRPMQTAGCVGRALWSLWMTLMKALNAGVTVLIAGAGIVIHHAGVEAIGLTCRFRTRFRGWVDQIGGRAEIDRVLTARETFATTIGLRLALAAVSIATFALVVLEFRGVGMSPSPLFSRDPMSALGPRNEVDTNVLVLMFNGPRPLELWVAIGTAFMSLPPFAEVDRMRELLATGSRRRRALATGLLPLRGLTRAFDRFDAVTTPLGLPAMLSSGVVGVIACLIAGGAVANAVIALLT